MQRTNKGKILIAEPFLQDENFVRTVILLCNSDENGDFGFVLNNRFDRTLDGLFEEFMGMDIPVYIGGPVQQDTLHFIHQYPELIPEAQKVTDDIFWGGNFETTKALIVNKSLDLNKIKFFIGYSGWDKNQLQDELTEHSWLTLNATSTLVFDKQEKEIWKNGIKALGKDYEMYLNFPVNPTLN